MRLASIGWLALALSFVTVGCGGPAARPRAKTRKTAPPVVTPDQRFAAAFDGFFPDYLARHPVEAASELGLHQFDGKLPTVTGAALAEQMAWLDRRIAEFTAFAPAELGEVPRVEREAVLATLRGERFELGRAAAPLRNPMWYLGALSLDGYVSRDYAPLAQRARGVIAIGKAAADHVLAAQANLPGTIPRTWVETALLMVKGHREFAKKDVAAAFAGLTDAALRGEVTAALSAYDGALADFTRVLEAARKNATDDFALGAELFLEKLAAAEGIQLDLATLEALGAADLERNLAALGEAAAAARLTPTRLVHAVTADRPSFPELLELARAQATMTRAYLIEKQLVTIPSDDVAEVQETPPFARFNSAFLSAPGVLEARPLPTFYWISPPDPSWPKQEQKEYIPGKSDLLFTTVHELWPGHFLHFLHMKRSPSRALKGFCSYAMSEGWAHYAEELMIEEGLGGGDPKVRTGMLLNALLRNVRFVSAIGLHARGMKVDESARLFVAKAFTDKKTARQQAVRGTFDPGYLNYTLGKLIIRKLRDDWKSRQGAAYRLGEFHDRFLSYGCAPLPAIRRAMLGDDSPVL